MKIIDNRVVGASSEVEVGDILDVTNFGLRMIVYNVKTRLFQAVSLENNHVQLSGYEHISEVVDFYVDQGEKVTVIKKDNIELILKGRKGE